MAASTTPFDSLRLYANDDCYVLEPSRAPSAPGLPPSPMTATPPKVMVIFRDTGRIDLRPVSTFMPEKFERIVQIWGILGMIRLNSGDYMIVITQRELVGKLDGHAIYRVSGTQMYPLAKSYGHLSPQKAAEETAYIQLMSHALRDGMLYFSPTYDLTNSLQRQATLSVDKRRLPLWQRADDRYFWNRHIHTRFIDLARAGIDISGFILPVVHAFIEIRAAVMGSAMPFTIALISRRSRFRVGTRYFVRGVDHHGHVANHVETEQIVVVEAADGARRRLSYVQTRGSIPVHWAQVVNIKYTPHLRVFPGEETLRDARKHFDDQLTEYGPQLILVNLVNRHGYERPVGETYASTVAQLNDPRLRYVHFDFHRECSGMRWDRIQLLIHEIEEGLKQQAWFYDEWVGDDHALRGEQHGVVRTNCMDCLDRTNVVQAALARWVLTRQLRQVGVLPEGGEVSAWAEFEEMYRAIWADNADAISTMYAGTGALKTDYTRLGKRTHRGALQDLRNSIVRYIGNNFQDGARQDAYDLFLGNYQVDANDEEQGRLLVTTAIQYRVIPLLIIISLTMLLYTLLIGTPYSTSEVRIEGRPGTETQVAGWMWSFTWFFMWLGLLAASVLLVLREAEAFVRWPRLVEYAHVEVLREAKEKGVAPPVIVSKSASVP